jgi:hypothetical protein
MQSGKHCFGQEFVALSYFRRFFDTECYAVVIVLRYVRTRKKVKVRKLLLDFGWFENSGEAGHCALGWSSWLAAVRRTGAIPAGPRAVQKAMLANRYQVDMSLVATLDLEEGHHTVPASDSVARCRPAFVDLGPAVLPPDPPAIRCWPSARMNSSLAFGIGLPIAQCCASIGGARSAVLLMPISVNSTRSAVAGRRVGSALIDVDCHDASVV